MTPSARCPSFPRFQEYDAHRRDEGAADDGREIARTAMAALHFIRGLLAGSSNSTASMLPQTALRRLRFHPNHRRFFSM